MDCTVLSRHILLLAISSTFAYTRGFHKQTKISNIGIIANFLFLYISSFLLNLQYIYMMLVNVKLNISGCDRITFQVCRSHWSSSYVVAQLKQIWKYWLSCVVESLWKILLKSSIMGFMTILRGCGLKRSRNSSNSSKRQINRRCEGTLILTLPWWL